MNIVSNIDMIYLPLRKGNYRQFFPKNTTFPKLTHLAALIAEKGKDVSLPNTSYKVITRDIASCIFLTLVDCGGQIIAESMPLVNIDVLLNLKLKLSTCVDWSKSFMSKSKMEDFEAKLEEYALPLYLFESNEGDYKQVLPEITMIEVPAGYDGLINRFVSEDQCLNVRGIKITTAADNNVWLNVRDSFGRGFKLLHNNVFACNDGVGILGAKNKAHSNWQFDNLLLDLETTRVINGNSVSYITIYHE